MSMRNSFKVSVIFQKYYNIVYWKMLNINQLLAEMMIFYKISITNSFKVKVLTDRREKIK